MDVSQYLYPAIVVAILVAVAVIWLVMRLRNRGGAMRIEPGMGTQAPEESIVSRTELMAGSDNNAAPPMADMVMDTMMEPPAQPASKIPERPIEQGYKGFMIQLREKEPGLWVASIADSTSRSRKRPSERASITHEYYQMPAALAEAKVLIDRRLAARH